MATPRRPRNLPAPRPNPFRDLVTQKNRGADAVRERRRVQELKSELPSIIQERVGEQIQKLETRLLTEVREIGQRAIEESTAAISDQLSGRIETLEKVSAMQTQTLTSLRDSSQKAERQVSAAVDQIEQSLASVVPGFELEPSTLPAMPAMTAFPDLQERESRSASVDLARMPEVPLGERHTFMSIGSPLAGTGVHPQFLLEEPMEVVKAEPNDISEIVGKLGFCPNCTSVDVRRSNRKGMFEEFLRLFFIAPFRCRACRHKFYRF